MFAVLLAFAAYLYFFYSVIFRGFRIGSFLMTMGVLFVATIVLIFWSLHHLTRPRQRRAPAPQQPSAPASPATAGASAPADPSPGASFRVAGVTFDNDDGSSRQDILRHIKFRDNPYASPDEDILVDFVESDYNGELALAVTLNGYQVGFVPRTMIRKVKAALDSHAWTVDSCTIYGGSTDGAGEKHSFGCEISISWTE